MKSNLFTQVFLIAAFTLSACSKMDVQRKGGATALPNGGVEAPKNPAPLANAGTSSRVKVRDIEFSGHFLDEVTRIGLYSSLDTEYACAQWVEIRNGSQTTQVLELINSENCTVGGNSVFPDDEVVKRLIIKSYYGAYRLYSDNQNVALGELLSTTSGWTLSKLCTDNYYYEEAGGVCIMTTSESSGLWEELTVY